MSHTARPGPDPVPAVRVAQHASAWSPLLGEHNPRQTEVQGSVDCYSGGCLVSRTKQLSLQAWRDC